MILIRQARRSDQRQLLKLARELDSINLPTDTREMAGALARSERSFRGELRDRSRAVYIFCAEHHPGRLAGASLIIGKHGTPAAPHYYLQMDSDERYSHTLRRMFRHDYLRLRYSMDGPTEIGGLVVRRAMRRHPERIGRQLSWVRFLYIACHPRRFEPKVLAEMLPPPGPNHTNPFWDHFGRPVTGLSFREADRLSIHDKEFIRALFPESPLYTFLLPEEVRASLGAVGEQTHGAVRLLEQAGMKFLNHLDPFDGGPYYGCATRELLPVKHHRSFRIAAEPNEAASDDGGGGGFLIARDDRHGFRAVRTRAKIAGRRMLAPRSALEALSLRDGDRVDTVPLP